jgi:hypothetical protein
MLRIRRFALATGLAVALSAVAPSSRAQGLPGGPGPGPGGMTGMGMGMGMGMGGQNSPLMTLLAPSVQKELKLSEEQKTKVYNLSKAAGQRNRDLAQSMAFAGGNGNANPQAMMEAGQRLRQETDKAIGKILDSKQKVRLDQIALRAEGPLAIARPEIAAKLRLNDTQNEFVQGVMMQMRQELFVAMRQGAAAGQFDPAQARTMATQLRKNAVQEISKVIDRKQKAAFDKMLGEPFDVSKIDNETAAAPADPTANPSETAKPADAAKPAETPADAKDAPAAADDKAKEPAKDAERPAPAPKKGRSRAGANR